MNISLYIENYGMIKNIAKLFLKKNYYHFR